MFGQQQPDADLIAGNLVGQELTHAPLHTGRVRLFESLAGAGALGQQGRRRRGFGVKGVQFSVAPATRSWWTVGGIGRGHGCEYLQKNRGYT
jgi:hypothetical protein